MAGKSLSHRLRYVLVLLAVVPLVATLIYGASEIVRFNSTTRKAGLLDSVVSRTRRSVSNDSQRDPQIDPAVSAGADCYYQWQGVSIKLKKPCFTGTMGGAVYTRWGRTVCPDSAELVYHGSAGGSFYNNHGGGSNYLCLPPDPIWGYFNEAVEKAGKLYGAEYQDTSGPFGLSNAGNKPLTDHNVPCAVCRSKLHSSQIMIPGRNICYDGWNFEFNGYLVTGHPSHPGRSEFVCMDENPEAMTGGFPDQNGALFYAVEAVCGALPCPSYIPRRDITCAVCTK